MTILSFGELSIYEANCVNMKHEFMMDYLNRKVSTSSYFCIVLHLPNMPIAHSYTEHGPHNYRYAHTVVRSLSIPNMKQRAEAHTPKMGAREREADLKSGSIALALHRPREPDNPASNSSSLLS